MPTYIKVIITLLVTITAVGAHFQQAAAGQSTNQWVVLFLGAFMIFALWLFPETKKGRR
jgi:hypothetical protein